MGGRAGAVVKRDTINQVDPQNQSKALGGTEGRKDSRTQLLAPMRDKEARTGAAQAPGSGYDRGTRIRVLR